SKGLDFFFSQNGAVLHHYANAPVRALLKPVDGKLWVATEAGVYRFDSEPAPDSQHFTLVDLPGLASPSSRALLQDQQGNIWIATTQGLFKYHHTTQQATAFEQGLKSPARILSLTHGLAGSVWVGSTLQGLYHIGADNSVKQYRYDKSHQFSLADNAVIAMMTDAGGVLWAGTFNAGVSRLSVNSLAFGLFNDSVDSVSCLPNAAIYSVYASSAAVLLGTESGLVQIGSNGDCKVYGSNTVKAIYADHKQQLWLGLGPGKGMAKYDRTHDRFNRVDNALSQANINFITQDKHQRLVVATKKDLYVQDSKSHDFTLVDVAEPQLQQSDLYVGNKDKKGTLWLGTNLGLSYFDAQQHKLVRWTAGQSAGFSLPVKAMYITDADNAWLGSIDGGLYKVNLSTGATRKIDELGGLSATADVNAIINDDLGYLWISTSGGLLRYNPQTDQSHLYRTMDGLQSDVFFVRSAFKAADGQLFFGGRKGFNRFYPQHIKLNQQAPKVAITGFSHFNQRVGPNVADAAFQLPKAIEQVSQLDLSYRDYVFGFEFSAFDYADSARNQYAYQLIGFDQRWNYTDAANRRITYTNLDAGKYTFVVKAANKDGVWNERGSAIVITVGAAPWATPWAYASYVLLLLGSFGAFFKYRTAALSKRAHQLQLSVDERTAQLKHEKHIVEQLLSQKNDEFANVSHEFRTPLTLVLGPVGQLLNSDISEAAKQKLTTVRRNGFRLLRMVDQLLQMEKFKVAQTVNKSVVALQPLLTLIGQSFQDLAKQQQVDLDIEPIADVYLRFTPDGLEKILLNLLSNALKYTPAGGNIWLRTMALDGEVRIEVADSGIGIAKDQQQAIFERFVRVMDARSEQVTGAGIGLALVKELVEAHQGKIELVSELGKGTTIAVILPTVQADENARKGVLNQDVVELELESFSGQMIAPLPQVVDVATEQNLDQNSVQASEKDSRPNLLIIEDNPDMRDYIYQSLCQQYQCVVEANGEAGVERAIAIIPDIIISDVMMPIMDGYEVTKAIKSDERTSHIPVVLLTARDDKQSRLKGWIEKADEYLTKPFDTQELTIRIDNLLAIRDILRDRFNQCAFEHQSDKPTKPSPETLKQQAQQAFLSKLNDIIEQLYTSQQTTMGQIAKQVAMGERQLFRKLKGTVGMSTSEYLRRFRLEKACELLRQGVNSSTVALEVGFASHSYFTRCFSAQYGCAPSEFV
ncbi:MAG: response regulator, partial [Algicola sp.]|nr:response regulator [Algicola sp.]